MASLIESVARRMHPTFQAWALESYQPNWRQRNARTAAKLAVTALLQPTWLKDGSAASFYTSKTPYALDVSIPLWSNLGYWRDARTIVESQIHLARLLGEAARLGSGDHVLDAGCGSGDQDLLWCRECNVGRIIGVEVTPVRAELANARAASVGFADHIHVQVGSATRLSVPSSSIDRVVALESAMHFDTRTEFFREAFRVLRPGGVLALADMAVSADAPTSFVSRLLQQVTRRLISLPTANVQTIDEYAADLTGTGFVDVSIQPIGDFVFPGCVKYCAMLASGGTSDGAVPLDVADFRGDQWNSQWRDGLGLGEYILVSARKPAINPSA